ncbi:unnamed protein product, partial [marine sediment metagenome]
RSPSPELPNLILETSVVPNNRFKSAEEYFFAKYFEKNEGPGLIGKDIISHNILQYKFAWANHFCAGMLLYRVQSKDATELANAEAAGGGGCFIQNGLGQPEIRKKWRCFFENHDELLVGYDSASPVGVCFLYDQLWWNSWDHLREVFRLTDYLSAR